tara:strand:+ start:5953 stop:6900 length:948 start_codon:yes stop_codon:yes gene_type:complete
MAETMIVSGIGSNFYLINNPIWVDITSLISVEFVKVSINVVGEADIQTTKLYINNEATSFDLSPIVKGYMPPPKHPEVPVTGNLINTNYINLLITLQSVTVENVVQQTIEYNRIFLRGGYDTERTNRLLGLGSVLKESNLLPRWSTYPLAKYYIDLRGDGIYYDTIIPANEIDLRTQVGCDPLYVRFLNTKGGYSFWLFERWSITKSGSGGQKVTTRQQYETGAKEVDYKVTVSGRVEVDYYKTMQALAESGEVYILGLDDLAPTSGSLERTAQLGRWVRVYNPGNSVKVDANKDVEEFSFDFEPMFRNKPSVIW